MCGLNGRDLRLAVAEETYTDTETLFVPALLGVLSNREDNFRLYKAIVSHQWAQTWFGTWQVDHRRDFDRLSARLASKQQSVALFHALETERLEACIAREMPGLGREMAELRASLDEPSTIPGWSAATRRLRESDATVRDSYALLERIGPVSVLPSCCYAGVLRPERVAETQRARRQSDKDLFRIGLARLLEEERADGKRAQPDDDVRRDSHMFQARRIPAQEQVHGQAWELLLDARPVVVPEGVSGVMQSIIQDLGEIPAEYLQPAGPGVYRRIADSGVRSDPSDVWQGVYHEEGAFLYREWDLLRKGYRKNWCVLRETDVQPVYDDFAERTLRRYSGLVKSLRNAFEALRGEDKLLKRQTFGEDIDIDALVEAYGDVRRGLEMSERVFTRLQIALSDGKPEDYDGYYRGDYGIEDTRQALFEARQQRVHPFCVTIDEEARDYLPHMYGAANYVVIDEVRKLPLKVSDIYRRLTS